MHIPPSHSMKRNLLLSVLSLTFVTTLLVVAEIIVRFAAPSLANPLVSEVEYDGIEWYQVNRSFLRKYFPSDAVLIPELKPGLIRRVKTDSTFRVFCLGGSSMFGTPYNAGATIPDMVRKQLRHLHPDREIEVISLAAAAINSNVIADLAPRILECSPDLVLIYMGHNEFYGPEGVGASWLEKRWGGLIHLKYTLRDLRLVAWARRVLNVATPSATGRNGEITLMKQVSQNNHVRLDSDEAGRIFRRFRENLETIIKTFQTQNVTVIVSTITSNLKFPPFASEEGGEGAKALYDRGMDALGNSLFEEARELLRSARDHDLLKFRAPTRMNAIIASVCSVLQVPLIDSEELFESLSPHNIPGNELFWEHLHPKAQGYYHIANLFVGKTRSLGSPVSESNAASARTLLPFDPAGLSISWLDLAGGDLTVQALTTKWPFQNYAVTPEVIDGADPRLLDIARRTVLHVLTWDEGCYESAAVFLERGMVREARVTYEAILEEFPHHFYAHGLLGRLMMQTGELRSAERHLRFSIRSNPSYAPPRAELGLLLVNTARFDEAIAELNAALRVMAATDPPSLRARIHYGLGGAYVNKRDPENALRALHEAIRLAPTYQSAIELRDALRSRKP